MQENKNTKSEVRKKGILKRAAKLFLIVSATAFIALVLLIIFLKYFIPTTLLKEKVETVISEIIKGEAKIGSLYLDPFSGIGVKKLHIKSPDIEKVEIDHIVFKYDFFALFRKEIIIDEIEISDSNISIILPEKVEEAKEPEKEESIAKPVEIPDLPFSIEIEKFLVVNSNVALKSSAFFDISVKNINFNLECGLKNQLVKLSGKLTAEIIALLLKGKGIETPLNLDFALAADLKNEEAVIDSFNIDAGSLFKASITGKASHFFSEKKIELNFFNSKIDLEKIFHTVRDFIPEELSGLKLAGVVEPTLSFKGVISEVVNGKISLALNAKGLSLVLEKMGLSIASTEMKISIPEVKIAGSDVVVQKSGIIINSSSGKFKEYGYKELNISLSPEYIHKSFASLILNLSAKEVAVSNSKLGLVRFPLKVSTELSSDLVVKSLNIKRVDIVADGVAALNLTAGITPAKQGKKYSVKSDLNLNPDIEGLVNVLPKEIRSAINVKKKNKDDKVAIHLSGVLGSDFKPEVFDLETDILISESKIKMLKPEISLTLAKTDLNVKSKYSSSSKKISAKITSRVTGGNLKYGSEAALGGFEISADIKNSGKFNLTKKELTDLVTSSDIKVTLSEAEEFKNAAGVKKINGKFKLSANAKEIKEIASELANAKFSSLIEITGIHIKESRVKSANVIFKSQNRGKGISNLKSDFTITAGGINHEDKNIKARIKSFKLSGNTALDLNNKEFSISKLKISADDFLKVSGNGFFNKNENLFSVETEVDKLNLSKLRGALSGELVKKLTEFRPEGVLYLSLKGSGRIPEKKEIEAYIFPVAFDLGLNIKNGGVNLPDGGFFNKAKFNTTLSFDHRKNNLLAFESKFEAKKIDLPKKSPVKKLKNFQYNVRLKSENFNDLAIEKVSIKFDGANFALKGALDSLPELASLSKINPQKVLQKFYTNLNAKADIATAEFSELLNTFGVESSGRTGFSLDLRKTEKGNVEAMLLLNCEKLNLKKGSILIKDVSCEIPLHKNYYSVKPSFKKVKSSGDSLPYFLSSIKHTSKEGQNLRIKNIDLGFLKINNVTANVSFENEMLKVMNLAMNLLDGGIGGQIFLKSGTPFGSSSIIQISDINVNKLLTEDKQISGDALVSAIVNTALYLKVDEEGIDFEMMDLSLEITKIGKETLDRLLLFIDLEESKPAITNARAKIKFANPSTVKVNLKKGIMGLEIGFQQGLMSSLKIERIPVVSVKNLKKINSFLAPLSKLAKVMQLIAEESYFIEQDGMPVINQ